MNPKICGICKYEFIVGDRVIMHFIKKHPEIIYSEIVQKPDNVERMHKKYTFE